MTAMDKFALLTDLARLVKKYGPDVFSDLAVFLRDQEAVAELVTILEAAGTAGRKVGIRESCGTAGGAKGGKGSIPNLIADLEKHQPEKAKVLLGFHEAISTKRALPNLRTVRSFLHDNGLKEIRATSRGKAIGPLLRDLAERSLEDIRLILGRVKVEETTRDRTLEGWTDVILDKDRTGRR